MSNVSELYLAIISTTLFVQCCFNIIPKPTNEKVQRVIIENFPSRFDPQHIIVDGRVNAKVNSEFGDPRTTSLGDSIHIKVDNIDDLNFSCQQNGYKQ